jgi:hypothetical protein
MGHAYAHIGRVIVMVPPVSQVMPRMRKDARTARELLFDAKPKTAGQSRVCED